MNDATTSQAIAMTIIEQLSGTIGKLTAMTGAKHMLTHDAGVSFKFGRGKYVEIMLDDSDTYNVEFSRLVKYEKRNVKSFNLIYADQLKDLFENETGLYLSL